MPFYVAYMIGVDIFFNSPAFDASTGPPLWLIVAFAATSLLVFVVVVWFLVQKVRGKVSVKRERFYVAMFLAMLISGFVDDALKGLASLIFNVSSIWVMIPLYLLSGVVLLAIFAFIMNRFVTADSDSYSSAATD
jgi:hypothetical protein